MVGTPIASSRQTAALLLAASFREICPGVIFSNICSTRLGFCIEFILPFALTKDHLDLIKTRVKQKLTENTSLDEWEMISSNAKDYLKHLHQPFLADSIDLRESLTKLCKLDEFAIPIQEELSKDLSLLKEFYLQHTETDQTVSWHKKPQKVQKIEGAVFETKEEKKEFQKILKAAKTCDHRFILQKNHWLIKDEDRCIFTLEGTKLYRNMIQTWKESVESQGIKEIFTYGEESLEMKEPSYEVLLSQTIEGYEKEDFGLKTYFKTEVGLLNIPKENKYEQYEKNFIEKTILQTTEDFSRIFGLTMEQQDSKALVWIGEDFYKIAWTLIEAIPLKSKAGFKVKFFFNRMFALILEKNLGWPKIV